jgi:hydroxymethylglutaryl-CoA lyase
MGMNIHLPKRVEIHEVVLRDGIQNEKRIVPTAEKVRLVQQLADCGIRRMEISSFVNPKLVPQMADAEELWERIERKKGVMYSALILSEKGLDRAIRCRVPHASVFVSASETHSIRNSNKSVAEAMREALRLIGKAREAGMGVRAGVMNAFGCAYDGKVPVSAVLQHVRDFMKRGPDEIGLADTTGMANPLQSSEVLKQLMDVTGDTPVSVHFHNTRDLGLANVWAAINAGVTIFDSSLGGLGGCPFIPGAKGNIATEDVVHMMSEMDVRTSVDLDRLIDVSLGFEKVMGQTFPAFVTRLRSGVCAC